MDLEDSDKYELYIKNTIYSNIFFLPLWYATAIYFQMFGRMIDDFSLPEMMVIALFIFAYSAIKIVGILSQINLEYRPRKHNENVSQ